jgi:hypothetical protein
LIEDEYGIGRYVLPFRWKRQRPGHIPDEVDIDNFIRAKARYIPP